MGRIRPWLGLSLWLGCACSQLFAVNLPLAWQWSHPAPHGANIIDAAFNDQLWIQVAERGQIFTSSDLLTWTPRDSHTTKALRSVTFFQDKIVIVGEETAVVSGPSAAEFSLLNLGSADWLESVAASPQLAVAVGDNGAIYTSSDGSQWQRQNPPFTDWLRSVAFGTPEGQGLFVAVGEAGFVATSPNGMQWATQSALTPENLNRVSWYNGEFWVVGDAGAAFQSATGKTWLPVPSGATNNLNAFAGLDALRVIAGESEVRLRQGRANWTNELVAGKEFAPPDWTYLSAAADHDSVLLCGRTGMMVDGLLTTNGFAGWVTLSDSPRHWLWDVKRFPNVYLAVGDRATILSSSDGVTWESELPPDSATNSIFLGIGGRNDLAVAVGNAGTIITSRGSMQLVISTNANGVLVTNEVSNLGIFWEAVTPPVTADLQGVTALGQSLVVTGGNGTILTSSDGRSWTRQQSPTTALLSSVEAYPGGLVAVGAGGVILTSPDGVNWSQRSSGTQNWIYRVRYAGDRLVAVGQNGTVLTSVDGAAWAAHTSGTTRWLNDVHWIGGTYFAIGNQGAVLSSTDGSNWTDRGTITGKSLFAAASHPGMFVTVGVEGVILRAQVEAVQTGAPVFFLQYPRGPAENRFVFSGAPGQRFTLDRSPDLTSWTSGPLLQIDSSGRFQHEDSSSNAPLQQFFRTSPR